MKKWTAIFTFAALLFAATPNVRAADFYANEVTSASLFDLLYPQNALGVPDGVYTEFQDQGLSLVLDMGEGEEGLSGVLVYIVPQDIGATARVTLTTADGEVLVTETKQLTPGTTEWNVPYFGLESFRYVKIESVEDEPFKVDAVQALAMPSPAPEPEEEPTEEPVDDEASEQWGLVKLATDSAVYYLDADGIRHPFPNEATYFSWGYGSFADVETVDAETMASYPMGDSVRMKSGAALLKLPSAPQVYAVAPGGVLRWIASEEVAIEIYGADWASDVLDLSEAFWTDYTVGENIDSADDVDGWLTETAPF